MFLEIFLFILLVFLFLKANQKPKGIPPGEFGLPIVGYIPFMTWKIARTLTKLEKKHGNIFSLKLGSKLFIVLSDYNLIKTAFSKPELSGRCSFYSHNIIVRYLGSGIATSNGNIWETNRKFAMKTLKEFGMGKSKLEGIIHTEAEVLIKTLKDCVNKPIQVDWNLNIAFINILWKLVANRRYDINDKEFIEFMHTVFEIINDVEGFMAILNILPWLEPWIPKFIKDSWMNVGAVEKKRQIIEDHFMNTINEHKETLDPNNPKDYIDKYLIEIRENKDKPEYFHFGDTDLFVTMIDLFFGGSETSSSTLRWFFIYMAKYQDIQKRVQKEIDQIVPMNRLPSLQDKINLPCLEALMHEINRKISLFPTGVPHECTEDTTLGDYLIPRGAIILINMESCHNDKRYWNNPNEFSLEHFLDEDGKFVSKVSYLPFSTGRRQCVGESLGKMELFLFMGAILQNFSILEPEEQNLSLEPDENVNLLNYAQQFEIVLKNRL